MSVRINILTNNEHPNSRAFNCPLLATRDIFLKRGYELHFRFSSPASCLEGADILFVNSNVFRNALAKNRQQVFSFLEKAARSHLRIYWFDSTESSSCNHFDVLPYVDCLLKGQMLADRSQYLKGFKTGSPFTDYFDQLYKCSLPEAQPPLPQAEHMHKLALSWNSCFEDYNESRFKFGSRLRQRLRRYTAHTAMKVNIKIDFAEISAERPVNISCRLHGSQPGNAALAAHRKALVHLLKKLGADTAIIAPSDYFDELRRSKIAIGPFGAGEITFRDYEAIICGATLVKPDMSHIETWPELFQVDRSFIAHKWDLSDLEEKLTYLLERSAMRSRIAWEAQEIYHRAISPQGLETFAGRLACAIESRS